MEAAPQKLLSAKNKYKYKYCTRPTEGETYYSPAELPPLLSLPPATVSVLSSVSVELKAQEMHRSEQAPPIVFVYLCSATQGK